MREYDSPAARTWGTLQTMKKALVLIANGSEEVEAVTVIDLLRRAKLDVVVAGLDGDPVTASRGVRLLPDRALADVVRDTFDLVVLPGGLTGVRAFSASQRVKQLVIGQLERGGLVGAICAAPAALREFGVLKGRKLTSYPGAIPADDGSYQYLEQAVVEDGALITSRGPGTAIDFALALIERLAGTRTRDEVEAGLVRQTPLRTSAS